MNQIISLLNINHLIFLLTYRYKKPEGYSSDRPPKSTETSYTLVHEHATIPANPNQVELISVIWHALLRWEFLFVSSYLIKQVETGMSTWCNSEHGYSINTNFPCFQQPWTILLLHHCSTMLLKQCWTVLLVQQCCLRMITILFRLLPCNNLWDFYVCVSSYKLQCFYTKTVPITQWVNGLVLTLANDL